MQYEAAVQSALAEFQAEMGQIFGIAMESRDKRILNAIGDVDDLRRAQMLGLLHPPWLQLDRDVASMRSALSRGLDATRHGRQYDLMQQTARDVEHSRKQRSSVLSPSNFALPLAQRVLGATEVATLRGGTALVIDSLWRDGLVTQSALRAAEADFRRLLQRTGVPSDAPCNTGARNCFVPLLGEGPAPGGPSFDLSAETRSLLRLLAALPAEIDRHGWPCGLMLPSTVQVACYSAAERRPLHASSRSQRKRGAQRARDYDSALFERRMGRAKGGRLPAPPSVGLASTARW